VLRNTPCSCSLCTAVRFLAHYKINEKLHMTFSHAATFFLFHTLHNKNCDSTLPYSLCLRTAVPITLTSHIPFHIQPASSFPSARNQRWHRVLLLHVRYFVFHMSTKNPISFLLGLIHYMYVEQQQNKIHITPFFLFHTLCQ